VRKVGKNNHGYVTVESIIRFFGKHTSEIRNKIVMYDPGEQETRMLPPASLLGELEHAEGSPPA
jgi:hypothetical protein